MTSFNQMAVGFKVFSLPHPECQFPGADLEINPTLESLCLSMTEHALGGKCPPQTLTKQVAGCQNSLTPPLTSLDRSAVVALSNTVLFVPY